MKSGMIVELHDLGEVQVIGEVKFGQFKEVWGIGISSTHKTIMRPSGKLLNQILKACKKKDAESNYEQAVQVYLTHSERLDCIKFMAERIEKESLETCE